jgi:hypothetical protein
MTSQMKSVQRHLCRGFTDGLASNDTNSFARFDKRPEILEIKHLLKGTPEDLALFVFLLVLEQLVRILVTVL